MVCFGWEQMYKFCDMQNFEVLISKATLAQM